MAATKKTSRSGTTSEDGRINAGDLREAFVDHALKRRWDEAISRYRKAVATGPSAWDARYEALDQIPGRTPEARSGARPVRVGAGLRPDIGSGRA